MIVGIIGGILGEEVYHNMVMEEITELLFYVSLVSIIYLYACNNNFQKNWLKAYMKKLHFIPVGRRL